MFETKKSSAFAKLSIGKAIPKALSTQADSSILQMRLEPSTRSSKVSSTTFHNKHNSASVVQVTCDAIDKAIEKGALHHLHGNIVLPRISDEHMSTVRSLCTIARDTWSDLLFASPSSSIFRSPNSEAPTIPSQSFKFNTARIP